MRSIRFARLFTNSLAIATIASSTIAVAGAPSFAVSRFAVPAGAQRLAAGDLDGDSDRDLVVLAPSRTQSVLSVYLNGGSGTFGPGWSASLPAIAVPGSCDLDLSDLDLDGDLDIVFHVPGATSEIRRNDGAGSFGTTVTLPIVGQHVQTSIAPIDAGAVPDLVTYSLNPTGVVSLWQGLGNGGFALVSSTPIGNDDPHLRMQLGDVTNDGLLDLVRAGSFGIEYLAGQAGSPFPKWGAPTLAWFDPAADLELAHLGSDNLLDAVVTIPFSGAIEVFHGTPSSGLFGPGPYPGGVSPGAMAVGDLDSDSVPDVIVASRTNNVLSILPGSAGGIYLNAPALYPGVRSATDLITADLDGDGDLDIAGTLLGGHVVVLENQLVP